MRRIPLGLAAALLAAGLAAGCSADDPHPEGSPASTGSTGSGGGPAAPASTPATDDPALDVALSTPVEDDVYPDVGDPGVDALHYGLDLTWSPEATTLTGVETLVFRATRDARRFQLDLEQALEVTSVRVDGEDADFDHPGKDLVVHAPVTRDARHTLVVEYTGRPEPVDAPTTRSDFDTVGWTTTADGGVWTMQEPFGAYSWYAVNDQPSDKALYDFTISVPSPMVGVANGTLESRDEVDGDTVTHWRLDEPAASYLTTIAIGDYLDVRDRSDSGVPVTYWVPTDRPDLTAGLRSAADELDWIEARLGPYPFSSLGIVLVDSRSGMETQTMLTLGETDYATSPEVLVHEMVHQWYGDVVTPASWSGVWMSEGMAMYLQGMWQAESTGVPFEQVLQGWAAQEPAMRRQSGPPADFDPATFGEGNVYYGPALMWDALRRKVGDDAFWSGVRAWPEAHEDGNATYDDIVSFWSDRTGQDLEPLFDAWLLGRASPRS
ncbi:M1 family metallopeptidase [Nocardioides sp. MAHUQ-72]|uniref:M1 family metallopeptidase n=1 Tax=unclassified Nocardioides TaxID=2615069 RepID=UPI003614016C